MLPENLNLLYTNFDLVEPSRQRGRVVNTPASGVNLHAGPKGHEFESHRCHFFVSTWLHFCDFECRVVLGNAFLVIELDDAPFFF